MRGMLGMGIMRVARWTALAMVLAASGPAGAQGVSEQGTEEFGMTPRQLTQAVEQVERLIARCMREEGFQYVAADPATVRAGMSADKRMPGMTEREFIQRHGFGIATLYTGEPPQLSTGYSPARVGLGERNVSYFRSLSAADQTAYNRALLGGGTNVTFAVALEQENFSATGGCTRDAVARVFRPEQLVASYYNPGDAAVNSDPRMRAALRDFARQMKDAGFDYNHPDEIEPDIRTRLAALTNGGTLPVAQMSTEQRNALRRLQDYEMAVASRAYRLQEDVLKPIEERIQMELFTRPVQ